MNPQPNFKIEKHEYGFDKDENEDVMISWFEDLIFHREKPNKYKIRKDLAYQLNEFLSKSDDSILI